MRARVILLAFALAMTAVAFVPSASAFNGCTALDGPSCPGVVCYGRGGWYGYAFCVGSVYNPCDPAECPPTE